MIGKKFEGVDDKKELVFGDGRECFNKHSVQIITDRYKGKSNLHLYIGRPFELDNGRMVCPIYDCSGNGEDKLEHEKFAEIAFGSTEQMRAIRDEIAKDHEKLAEKIKEIGGDFDDERVADELYFYREAAMHALGWIRVYKCRLPDGRVLCTIDMPCKRYYKMDVTPEQIDTLKALLRREVIEYGVEDEIALGEDRSRQKEYEFDEFMKKFRAKHSEEISEL